MKNLDKLGWTLLIIIILAAFVMAANGVYDDLNMNENDILNASEVQGVKGNFSTVYSGNLYGPLDEVPGYDPCPNRPMFSTDNVTVVVYDGESIQDAICENLPHFLNHRLQIQVHSGYDDRENIVIPQYHAGSAFEYKGGQFRLYGTFGTYPKIGGIHIMGVTGQANPYFQYLNVTKKSPTYTGGCQICIFGTQQAEMTKMVFSDPDNEATYGLTSYASNVKISDSTFEGEPSYAIETKQGGQVLVSNLTGSVDVSPFYASQGNILIDHPISTISSTTGAETYRATLGLVLVQADDSWPYEENQLWGVDKVCLNDADDDCDNSISYNGTGTLITG